MNKQENGHALLSRYVRCINNKRFLFFKDEPKTDEEMCSLVIGQVYKRVPAEANDGDRIRIIDESGEDYLYPAHYFEPLTETDDQATATLTAHVPAWLQGVLHAEAVAADMSMSALMRTWLTERLDLPS